MLGVGVGLCVDAKRTGLSVVLAIVVCIVLLAVLQRWNIRKTFARFGLVLGSAAFTVAPLIASNMSRFGVFLPDRAPVDKLQTSPASLAGAGIVTALRDGWIPGMLWNAFETFWAAFGWGNLKIHALVYLSLALVCAVAVLGLAYAATDSWHTKGSLKPQMSISDTDGKSGTAQLLLVAYFVAIMFLPTFRAIAYQDRDLLAGRYLLPALPAIAVLISVGLVRIFNRLIWLPYAVALSSLMLATSVPAIILPSAYAPIVAQNQRSDQSSPLLNIGNRVQLVKIAAEEIRIYDIVEGRTLPFVNVSATWHVTGVFTDNLAFGISVIGRDNEVLGTANVFAQGGNYPTSNWRPGDEFIDGYIVELQKKDATLPALGRVSVTLFQPVNSTALLEGKPTYVVEAGQLLTATDPRGQSVTPIVGHFRISNYLQGPDQISTAQTTSLASFGGIALTSSRFGGIAPDGTVRAGAPVVVYFNYRALNSQLPQTTAFVHAVDESGKPITQDDHIPVSGYPSDLWVMGEIMSSTFVITPPVAFRGELSLETGVYQSATLERLPSATASNTYKLRSITVVP